jgi:hypothetical protein
VVRTDKEMGEVVKTDTKMNGRGREQRRIGLTAERFLLLSGGGGGDGWLGAAEDGQRGQEAVQVGVAALEVALAGTRGRSRTRRGNRARGRRRT